MTLRVSSCKLCSANLLNILTRIHLIIVNQSLHSIWQQTNSFFHTYVRSLLETTFGRLFFSPFSTSLQDEHLQCKQLVRSSLLCALALCSSRSSNVLTSSVFILAIKSSMLTTWLSSSHFATCLCVSLVLGDSKAL